MQTQLSTNQVNLAEAQAQYEKYKQVSFTQEDEDEVYQLQAELNQRVSIFTAYKTWKEQWHNEMMEIEAYADIFKDTCYLIHEWGDAESPGDKTQVELIENIAERVFYIVSTSPELTMSLVTVASKLEADCQELYLDYQDNITAYAEMVYHLRTAGLFTYSVTQGDHPIITPLIAVKGEIREELDGKFAAALPQVGGVVGDMDANGYGILPGIRFTGKSTRRKTPLNAADRAAITLVSKQSYIPDVDMINSMQYYVPTITDTGLPLSEKEQEECRTVYYRYQEVANDAHDSATVIQMPTSEDSRGRFYNMATDPAIRLSLRSVMKEGNLTEYEQTLIGE